MSKEQLLLSFFKALADANRLKIVGLLAHRPHAVEELATVLELRPSTVSHHLSKLSSAGLVSSTSKGHYHHYALEVDALHEHARSLLSSEDLRDLAQSDDDLDPFDKKVLSTFMDDAGQLKAIPMKRKKFGVILRFALRLFEDEGPWSEVEVNQRLKSISADVATLRRGFIDHGLMTRSRDGSEYRRA